MTIGHETRWAYSTTLPSPNRVMSVSGLLSINQMVMADVDGSSLEADSQADHLTSRQCTTATLTPMLSCRHTAPSTIAAGPGL